MGNSTFTSQNNLNFSNAFYQNEQDLLQKIVFIQSRQIKNQDLNLHQAQIFRFKQPPYEYIMKHSKVFSEQSIQSKQYIKTLMNLSRLSHKNIAQTFFLKNWVQNSMCLRTINAKDYSAFYGIQLKEIIYQRKLNDIRFEECQIHYILKSMLSIGSWLEKMNICFGFFKSKNLYISSEGYLKTYLYHIQQNNKHLNLNLMLCQKSSQWSKFIPFAPQYIQNLKQGIYYTQNLSPYKSDIFSIGMIIVQMIMDNQLTRYYQLSSIKQLKFQHQKLNNDILSLRGIYSDQILYLIQKITNFNPQNRWNYEQAQQYLKMSNQKIAKGSSLKMFHQEEEYSHQKNKFSYQSYYSNRQNIFKSIETSLENKLTVAPIKLLSSDKRQKFNLCLSNNKTMYTRRNSHSGMEIVSKNKAHNKNVNSRNITNNSNVNSLIKINKERQETFYIKYPQKGQNLVNMTLGNTRITENQNFTPQDHSIYCNKSQKLRLYQQYKNSQISNSRISITPIKQLKDLKKKSNNQKKKNGVSIKICSSKQKLSLR